jgi:membrane protein DedA with SNARE-associated domain
VEWLTAYLEQFTYIGVAVSLFLAGLGFPLPEDIPLIFGGAMAGAGKINVWVHFAISMVFIVVGDTCLYLIGRKIGNVSEGGGRIAKLLTPERRKKAEAFFEKYGNWTIFVGRFFAGFRAAVYLTAGTVKFPLGRFMLLDFLAALISVPIWIYLGWIFGENWHEVIDIFKRYQWWVVGGIVLIVAAIWFIMRTRKKRAALAAAVVEAADAALPDAALSDEALPEAPRPDAALREADTPAE